MFTDKDVLRLKAARDNDQGGMRLEEQKCREMFDVLAKARNWSKVQCVLHYPSFRSGWNAHQEVLFNAAMKRVETKKADKQKETENGTKTS